MVPRRISGITEHGFSVAELVTVIAILGILAAIAIPNFLSYLQAAQTKGAAQEVAALLNQARQLAITQNQSVCADPSGSLMRFRLGSCAGTTWKGPGTDSAGNITLSNNAVFTATAQITFSSLGGASPAARLSVRNQANTSTMDIVINPTGRVRTTCAGCP